MNDSSDQIVHRDEIGQDKNNHHGDLTNASGKTKINHDNGRSVKNSDSDDIKSPSLDTKNQNEVRNNSVLVPISEDIDTSDLSSKISAYARLDFDNFTFFVQTLHLTLGRKSHLDIELQSNHHAVDVHLSNKKAVSRKHARLFYNFASQQFELSVEGRNGAFVDDVFIEKGNTVPLIDGTKVQIGDIPFVFVLPSLEVHQFKADKKQFNPTDAVNLRSNLYSSKSPTISPNKDKKVKLDITHKLPTSPRKSFSKQTRESLLKLRRLSNARRKSLASVAGDELNDILKELGVSSIDAIDENGSDLLDSQIQSLLNDHENNGSNLESSLLRLAQFNESAIEEEEDELDRLVKHHNLSQGIDLDDLDEIEISLAELDEEIDTVKSNINVNNNQELLKNLQNKRSGLLQRKQLTQLQQHQKNVGISKPNNPIIPPSLAGSYMNRSTTGPRMGKPASIQPPPSRLYNNVNGLPNPIDSRLVQTTKLTGLPTSLLAKGLQPLDLTQSFPYNSSTLMKPLLPPGTPPPKLEVPVLTITAEPSTIRFRPPLRAITTSYEPPLETFGIPTTNDEPSKYPKVPLRRNSLRKPPKKLYSLDEIPEQYRSKPTAAIPNMVTNALKTKNNENGLTLNEIYDVIKDMYPYYYYCPDGWQFSIAHNVKYNKIFKRLMKKGDEWSYALDELFINEREKVRVKQQATIAAKAKAAALKAEDLKSKQNFGPRNFTYGLTNNYYKPGPQYVSNPPYSQTNPVGTVPGQKPKTIAELASEIRRDGVVNSNAPLYFKPQAASSSSYIAPTTTTTLPQNTIKAQLAANRSQSKSQSPINGSVQSNTSSYQSYGTMNQNTKTSLTYLQKELFVLYKARKLSYDTATTTDVITKALATTIAQVNAIGSKAGCGDNALSFLIEKAPKQVTKILDIALTKSIKELQGQSANPTRSTTPITSGSPNSVKSNSGGSNQSPPQQIQQIQQIQQPVPQVATSVQNITTEPATAFNAVSGNPSPPVVDPSPTTSKPIEIEDYSSSESSNTSTSKPLPKPQSFGLGRPSTYSSLGRPAGLTRPVFNKPGALSRPPQFLSNKPGHQVGFDSQSEVNENNKRELIDDDHQK